MASRGAHNEEVIKISYHMYVDIVSDYSGSPNTQLNVTILAEYAGDGYKKRADDTNKHSISIAEIAGDQV